MAVQAQHPSSYAFSPHFRDRSWDNAGEELHNLLLAWNACASGCNKNAAGAVPSDLQRSELTCDKSASRKRACDAPTMEPPRPNGDSVVRINAGKDNLCLPGVVSCPSMYQAAALGSSAATLFPMNDAVRSFISSDDALAHSAGLRSGRIGSAGPSTSGRSAFSMSEPCVVKPPAQCLFSSFHSQSLEMDALVRAQSERLLTELDTVRKRHCKALLTAVNQQTLMLLKEKDAELDAANRRHAVLQGMLVQAAAVNQFWFDAAKNNEAMVATLCSRFEQVLQNVAANYNAAGARTPACEGFGECDGAKVPAEDAQSCCFAGDGGRQVVSEAARRPGSCKACGERGVCVVLLPCKHLCLCKWCESKVKSCPVCNATKNTSLQVLLS